LVFHASRNPACAVSLSKHCAVRFIAFQSEGYHSLCTSRWKPPFVTITGNKKHFNITNGVVNVSLILFMAAWLMIIFILYYDSCIVVFNFQSMAGFLFFLYWVSFVVYL
jgi:hypothetical protein